MGLPKMTSSENMDYWMTPGLRYTMLGVTLTCVAILAILAIKVCVDYRKKKRTGWLLNKNTPSPNSYVTSSGVETIAVRPCAQSAPPLPSSSPRQNSTQPRHSLRIPVM